MKSLFEYFYLLPLIILWIDLYMFLSKNKGKHISRRAYLRTALWYFVPFVNIFMALIVLCKWMAIFFIKLDKH